MIDYHDEAAAIAHLEGDWYWHFTEQGPPVSERRRLFVRSGRISDWARQHRVELVRGKARMSLGGDGSELRFDPAEEADGTLAAEYWERAEDDEMVFLEDAFIVRAERVAEVFPAGERSPRSPIS